ncbi:MAG: DinB family protein [Patescibacteria group bacterium]
MTNQTNKLLMSQFNLTWSLAEIILSDLTVEQVFWAPTNNIWSVKQDKTGKWRGEVTIPEPTPLPNVTISWLLWHIEWWWGSINATLDQKENMSLTEYQWSGSLADSVVLLRRFAESWKARLNSMTLEESEREVVFLGGRLKTVAEHAAWVNSELMKNIAEIGVLKTLYQNRVASSTEK